MTKRLVDPDALARCHTRYACEAGVSPGCTGRNDQAHHRKIRKQGGPDTDDNLLAVCTPCHDHIHGNPAQSYMNGTLIASWDEITPFER